MRRVVDKIATGAGPAIRFEGAGCAGLVAVRCGTGQTGVRLPASRHVHLWKATRGSVERSTRSASAAVLGAPLYTRTPNGARRSRATPDSHLVWHGDTVRHPTAIGTGRWLSNIHKAA